MSVFNFCVVINKQTKLNTLKKTLDTDTKNYEDFKQKQVLCGLQYDNKEYENQFYHQATMSDF